VLKNRKLHCPEERCHSFCSYISDNFASDFVIFGMLHRNGPSIQMDKYFSSLLDNAVPNDDIIVTSQRRFVSGVVVCQLVCRLAVDILNIIFSHTLSTGRLVDYFFARMCELTLQMILLFNCSLSLNVFNIGF